MPTFADRFAKAGVAGVHPTQRREVGLMTIIAAALVFVAVAALVSP